ncbi:hypothetical protein D3C80_2099980 [compost metagenome]
MSISIAGAILIMVISRIIDSDVVPGCPFSELPMSMLISGIGLTADADTIVTDMK